MTIYKRRAAGVPGYMDKWQAADLIGMHPTALLRAISKGTIRLKGEIIPREGIPWSHQQHLYPEEQVRAVAAQRNARKR